MNDDRIVLKPVPVSSASPRAIPTMRSISLINVCDVGRMGQGFRAMSYLVSETIPRKNIRQVGDPEKIIIHLFK
jgi:hypothetical protein